MSLPDAESVCRDLRAYIEEEIATARHYETQVGDPHGRVQYAVTALQDILDRIPVYPTPAELAAQWLAAQPTDEAHVCERCGGYARKLPLCGRCQEAL